MITAVFGASSSLPTLEDRGGKLVWSAEENAFLFIAHFDAKQFRDRFQHLQACDPSSVLCFVACRSSFICRLFLNFDFYGGTGT